MGAGARQHLAGRLAGLCPTERQHCSHALPTQILTTQTLVVPMMQVGDRFSALKDELERNIEESIRTERFGGLAGDAEGQAAGSPSAAAAGEGWGGSDIGSPLALRLADMPRAAEQAADAAADGAQAEAPQPSSRAASPAAASPAASEQLPVAQPLTKVDGQQQPLVADVAPLAQSPAEGGAGEQGAGAAASPSASPTAPLAQPVDAALAGTADGLAAAGSPAAGSPAADVPAQAAAAAVSASASPATSPQQAKQPEAGTPPRSPTADSPPGAADAPPEAAADAAPPAAAANVAAAGAAAPLAAAGAAAPAAAAAGGGDDALDEQALRALVRQLREALAAREQQIERKAQVGAAAGCVVAEPVVSPRSACSVCMGAAEACVALALRCVAHGQLPSTLQHAACKHAPHRTVCALRPASGHRRRPSLRRCWRRCRSATRSWQPARMARLWPTCSGEGWGMGWDGYYRRWCGLQ